MNRSKLSLARRATAFTLLAAAIIACQRMDDTLGQQPANNEPATTVVGQTFIGNLDGAPESARIAIVVEGDKYIGYVCSGDDAFNQAHSRWFRGTVQGGKFTARVDDMEITGAVNGEQIQGALKKKANHTFTAKKVDADGDAGLLRAATEFGDDAYVAGWIVEGNHIVGTGGRPKGPVNTFGQPKNGQNFATKIADKKGKNEVIATPKKVTGANPPAPANPANAANETGNKITPDVQKEALDDLVAKRRATGGNPVLAMVLNETRRFLNGAQPTTDVEKKIFAVLAKAPRAQLASYMKLWDALPANTRTSILGKFAQDFNVNKALTEVDSRRVRDQVLGIVSPRSKATARAALPGTVRSITIPTMRCIRETGIERFKDEIFAIYVVTNGSDSAVRTTAVLKNVDSGEEHNFAAADALIFPAGDLNPNAGAEISVVATLYEDDSGEFAKAINFLKPILQTAVVVFLDNRNKKDGGAGLSEIEKAGLKVLVDLAVDGAVATISQFLVKPLGTDAIFVQPDGTILSEDGGQKDKMRFREVKNGKVKYDFELKNFAVQKN
jgi:hypothetical protein